MAKFTLNQNLVSLNASIQDINSLGIKFAQDCMVQIEKGNYGYAGQHLSHGAKAENSNVNVYRQLAAFITKVLPLELIVELDKPQPFKTRKDKDSEAIPMAEWKAWFISPYKRNVKGAGKVYSPDCRSVCQSLVSGSDTEALQALAVLRGSDDKDVKALLKLISNRAEGAS